MSTFTLDQEQQLHRVIHSVSHGITESDEEQVFIQVEQLANTYYTILNDLVNKVLEEEYQDFERTQNTWDDEEKFSRLLSLMNRHQKRINNATDTLKELPPEIFEFVEEHRPWTEEYSNVG